MVEVHIIREIDGTVIEYTDEVDPSLLAGYMDSEECKPGRLIQSSVVIV